MQLAKYDAMCRAIDVAYDFDEVKNIRDKAAALEAAARVAKNVQAEERCYEIRRRAEARAAKLYDEQEKAKVIPHVGRRSDAPTLADLGTTKQEMSEWRQLANTPPKQFDAAFANGGKPSIAEITGKKKPERSAASSAALWVWGRILDFERNGVLEASPKNVSAEMVDHQREDLTRLIPLVSSWLKSLCSELKK